MTKHIKVPIPQGNESSYVKVLREQSRKNVAETERCPITQYAPLKRRCRLKFKHAGEHDFGHTQAGQTPEPDAPKSSRPGMDFWWDKFCEEQGVISPIGEDEWFAFACDFARWFAQHAAEAGQQYHAMAAQPAPKPDALDLPTCSCECHTSVPFDQHCVDCGPLPIQPAREESPKALRFGCQHCTCTCDNCDCCGAEESPKARAQSPLETYLTGQLAALEAEYGFTPALNLDDEDTTLWGDAKQRGYGRYAGLVSVREKL